MIAVSESALIKRINRRLARDGERLRTIRSERHWPDLGTHYVTDDLRNKVVMRHVDIVALGRDLGVLRAFEALE